MKRGVRRIEGQGVRTNNVSEFKTRTPVVNSRRLPRTVMMYRISVERVYVFRLRDTRHKVDHSTIFSSTRNSIVFRVDDKAAKLYTRALSHLTRIAAKKNVL